VHQEALRGAAPQQRSGHRSRCRGREDQEVLPDEQVIVRPEYFPMIRTFGVTDAAGDAVDDRHRNGAHSRVRLGGERAGFGWATTLTSVAVSAIGGHILAFARVACGRPCGDH